MAFQHILWVFDLAGPDTEFKKRDEALLKLNADYLANFGDAIAHAEAKWVDSNATIAPNKFDAVVFLIGDIRQSLAKKLGGTPPQKMTALGSTLLGATGGGLAEVYWDRCINSFEVAGSIFHEAAHLKSEQDDSMHNADGVRVLRADGGSFRDPSWGDLDFYEAAIKRPISRFPSSTSSGWGTRCREISGIRSAPASLRSKACWRVCR